jgi:hypothetical protein
MRVRGYEHARRAAARQIRLERVRVDCVIEDEQDSLAFLAELLHYGAECGLLSFLGTDPAQPQPERD